MLRWLADDDVRWAARRAVDMHVPDPSAIWQTGVCAKCQNGGCAMLTWATAVLNSAGTAGERAAQR